MRRRQSKWVTFLAMALVMALGGFVAPVTPSMADDAAGGAPSISTRNDRYSYSLGVETYNNYKRLGLDLNPDLIARGIKDAAAGKLLMSEKDVASTMIDFRGEALVRQRSEKIKAGLDNKEEGDKFLAANKTKEGVVTLPSGLQYKVLKSGNGKTPMDKDAVECNLRGTLINGTELENTFKTGEPIVFQMDNVRIIKGLKEALKLMPVGSRWQVFIPPQLAYLQYGKAPSIGPNATLIYEVELLAIK